MPADRNPGRAGMFERRGDLVRLLALADAERIVAAADRLAISDYRMTPDLVRRLMVAAGTAPPAAPSLRGLFARLLARK